MEMVNGATVFWINFVYTHEKNNNVVHQNYVGIDSEKNPYFLSIVSHESGNKSTPQYRAMLFRKQVCTAFLCFIKYSIN